LWFGLSLQQVDGAVSVVSLFYSLFLLRSNSTFRKVLCFFQNAESIVFDMSFSMLFWFAYFFYMKGSIATALLFFPSMSFSWCWCLFFITQFAGYSDFPFPWAGAGVLYQLIASVPSRRRSSKSVLFFYLLPDD